MIGLCRRGTRLEQIQEGDRILVSRSDHLGDLLMTLPTIQALARSCRRPVDVLLKPAYASLLQGQKGVGEVIGYPFPWQEAGSTRSGWLGMGQLGQRLRAQRYRFALECTHDLKNMAFLRWSGCGEVVAWDLPGARAWGHHCFPPQGEHQVERCLALAGELGALEADLTPRLELPEAWLDAGRCGLGDGEEVGSVVVLHLGAAGVKKRWPYARWLQLAEKLRTEGMPFRFLVGPAEEECRSKLLQESFPVLPSMNLPQLAGTLAVAGVFVGSDSGPAHLAAASGARGLVLFGPTHPERTAPRGKLQVIQRSLACQPCWLPRTTFSCSHQRECLEDLSVEQVWEALLEVMEGGPQKVH
jgi:heptosyltransferase-1